MKPKVATKIQIAPNTSQTLIVLAIAISSFTDIMLPPDQY